MGISSISYNPFAFQTYMKTTPNPFNPNRVMGLQKVKNLTDQYAVDAWMATVNAQKLGAYDPIDLVV